MRVHLLGVRGSTPAPGPEFAAVGGHTSCVAVARGGGAPALVLDAGTGLRDLPTLLGDDPFRGTLLLTHLHWDHTQGLPFCRSMDRPDARTRLLLPAQGDDAAAVLGRGMSPPHFPIGPDGLRGEWTFGGLEPGWHDLDGFRVLAREVPHKGGRTFGYRIEADGGSFAYLPDHAPLREGPGADGFGACHPVAVELTAGVDVLIHDAQYTAEELPARASFGHSAGEYAATLAAEAGAGAVLLFHHDPSRTDAEVAAITRSIAERHRGLRVATACQGAVVDL